MVFEGLAKNIDGMYNQAIAEVFLMKMIR